MGLRCSLLGHDFGETEVEREREEQGSEVVETVREVRTCGRCGETKLVSENTNVTTLDRSDSEPSTSGDAAGAAPDAEPSAAAEPAADQSATDGATADATGDPPASTAEGGDAEILDEAADSDAAEADETGATSETAGDVVTEAEDAEPDAEDDDAVILDEDDEQPSPDREYGQWPDSDDTGEPEPSGGASAWPEQQGEDQGYDAELSDEEADVEFGGGLTPEVDADADGLTGEETVRSPEVGESGITSAGAAPSPDAPADTTEIDTEFFCPECEQVTPADRSSLRAGDICPECKHGYITERER